jgi:hypothetical protein
VIPKAFDPSKYFTVFFRKVAIFEGFVMRNALLTLFLAAQLVPTAALAQTAEQKSACKADYRKFCTGVMPGGGRLIKCLSKHMSDLTPECQKVVKTSTPG